MLRVIAKCASANNYKFNLTDLFQGCECNDQYEYQGKHLPFASPKIDFLIKYSRKSISLAGGKV